MSPLIRILVSLVIATIAFTLSSLLATGEVRLTGSDFDFRLLLAFIVATVTTALLARGAPTPAAGQHSRSESQNPASETSEAAKQSSGRASGRVKWFNSSKGFGFIVMDNGEEIFVHYRSIRGEGRRSLRDGQQVSFEISQSDKGPQAEDVSPENS